MSGSSPYQVPRAPGRWRAIGLAVIVHMALLAFLWFGIHWQNETPLAVEAEIWDPTVREAAPLPPPPPEPEPEQRALPEPTPTPPPEAVKPPPQVEQPPVVKPDIALEKEKEKKRKELEKERERELEKAKLAKEKEREKEREKEQEKQKAKDAKLAKEKEEQLKKEKLEAEKKLQKQKEEAEAKKKAEADKLAAEKKQKQQAADNKAAEQRRQDDLKRMMNQASSSTGGTGDAAKSQGPRGSPDYANKIAAKIRSNTTFEVPPGLGGNPPVEYAVDLLPDGSVRSVRLKKPSGVPGFDEAVARAIEKSQPFPPDKDGKVPSSIVVIHKPKD